MPTQISAFQNTGRLAIEGSANLHTDATVLAISYPGGVTQTSRGDNMTCVKNGTGTYDFTMKGTSALKLVEVLDVHAAIMLTGNPSAAFAARVLSVLQTADTDDIVIKVATVVPATGAPTDITTTALTLSFGVVIRTSRPGNPL